MAASEENRSASVLCIVDIDTLTDHTPVAAEGVAPEDKRLPLSRTVVLLAAGLFVAQSISFSGLPVSLYLKDRCHLSPGALATFLAITGVPYYVKPLIGLLIDSRTLGAIRRRHYILGASVVAVTLWILFAVLPHRYSTLLLLLLLAGLAAVTAGTALGGLLVESGQKNAATGRFSALRVISTGLASGLAGVGGGWLATRDLSWSGWLIAGMWAVLVVVTLTQERENPAANDSDVTRAQRMALLREQLRELVQARSFWIVIGVLMLVTLAPGFDTPLLYLQTNTLHFTPQYIGLLQTVTGVAGFPGAVGYTVLCRRFRSVNLLRLTAAILAAGTLLYLDYGSHALALFLAIGSGLIGGVAIVALFDLAARATPARAAAVGYALLISTMNLTGMISNVSGSWLLTRYGWSFHDLVWLNAGSTALAAFVLRYLPRSLTDRREGGSTALSE